MLFNSCRKLVFVDWCCLGALVLIFNGLNSYGQKPPVNFEACDNWDIVKERIAVSNDGSCIAYTVSNQSYKRKTLFLQNVNNGWELSFEKAESLQEKCFTDDNRFFMFKKGKDSVGVVSLISRSVVYLTGISSPKLLSASGWLIYIKGAEKKMSAYNAVRDKINDFDAVDEFCVSPDEQMLVLLNDSMIRKVDLRTLTSTLIWNGAGAKGIQFDNKGGRFCFLTRNVKNQALIWQYDGQRNKTDLIFEESVDAPGNGMGIVAANSYTSNGKGVLLSMSDSLSDYKRLKVAKPTVKINVWGYRDTMLQEKQLLDVARVEHYKAILSLSDHSLLLLQERGQLAEHPLSLSDDVWLVSNKTTGKSSHLLLLDKRVKFGLENFAAEYHWFSQNGTYLLYFDTVRKSWLSYDINSHKTATLTDENTGSWQVFNGGGKLVAEWPPLAGWVNGDEEVVMRDNDGDFWLASLSGKFTSVNITNGYARQKHIAFDVRSDYALTGLKYGSSVLLYGVDKITKDAAYYRMEIGRKSNNPVWVGDDKGYFARYPVKARLTNKWFLIRMSASSSPNLYYTEDFRKYALVSNVFPERNFNWLTSELLCWKDKNEVQQKAILYKPENFDSTKKYPVIFYYYETMSDGVNVYNAPARSSGAINIPWFVSHGYLVCAVDVIYTVGAPGKSALKSILSTADKLCSFKFVDSSKLGLQGHSFGGYETNYVISQSNRFAAAVVGAGLSDLISDYNDLWGHGGSKQDSHEGGQLRMGCTLWDNKNAFIENSPIFYADKVSTPVLLMHNKEDRNVEFSQGLSFFNALTRLKKRAWLLQYENQSHVLIGNAVCEDYSIRVKQFFDHYLKAETPPYWMTIGVPAKYREHVGEYLKLDKSGRNP